MIEDLDSKMEEDKNDFVIVSNAFQDFEPTLSNIGNHIDRLISEVQNLKKTTLKQRWTNWRTLRNIDRLQEEYYDLSENINFLIQWDFTQEEPRHHGLIDMNVLDGWAPKIKEQMEETERILESLSAGNIKDHLKQLEIDLKVADYFANLVCKIKETDLEFCVMHSEEEKTCFNVLRGLRDISEKSKKSRGTDCPYQILFYLWYNVWFHFLKSSESDGFLGSMRLLGFFVTFLIVFALNVIVVKRTILFFKMIAEFKRLKDSIVHNSENTSFVMLQRRKVLKLTENEFGVMEGNTLCWLSFYVFSVGQIFINYSESLGIDPDSFSTVILFCVVVLIISFFIIYPAECVRHTKKRFHSNFSATGKGQREVKGAQQTVI